MEITKKPFLLSFAGNPMRYTISPDGTGGGGGGLEDGSNSVIEINVTNIDTAVDHAMQVTMFGETRTLTLKSSPSTKDHLPVAETDMSPSVWALSIYTYIIGDVELISNYYIALDGATITLTARVASGDFDISMGTSNIVGVTVVTTYAGSAGTVGNVEGVLMTVYKGATKLGEDYKPVDATGSVKFEIQEYIYASLLQALPPRFHLTVPSGYYHVFSDFILKYDTVFVERVDGVYLPRGYPASGYAISGGLNREDLVYNNKLNRDYFNLAATKKKFLTWTPPSRLTDKDETHSLYFAFQGTAPTACQFKANLYAGETGTQISITTLKQFSPFTVTEFFAGYTQLDLSTYMNGAVDRYELYLVDGDGFIMSDVREFILDKKYHENTRYFRFRNSWGAYDSFRCTGVVETTLEHEREKVVYSSDENETAYNAPANHTMISEAQNFKANSGWLTKEYLNFLRDMMLSADIYEVEDGQLHKCLLTSKKTSLFKDRNYNYSLAFEYERGYEDFFFQGSE